ncbi:MAG: Gx transporter family protein [Candidatus Cloacimonadaceae bacterium]|nr:Gx transporter family protein [Candidatus Cloacimonadaceae bacterium]MDP3115030.1 Gx transporter family protein [Candidatus Cloacimonadaceae bacterium]
MKTHKPLVLLAYLTATAASLHIVESLVMRMFPLPFIRIGLSNIVILYLIMQNQPLSAIIVNIVKTILGGAVTLTLLSPATLLSLGGGICAVVVMYLTHKSRLGFGVFGISIAGAVAHNLGQLILVKWLIFPDTAVFLLTPMLILIGMLSGMAIAYIMLVVSDKLKDSRLINNDR